MTCTSASDHTQSVVNSSAGASETAAANAAHVGSERPVSLAARRASSTHDSAPSPALRRRPLRYRPTGVVGDPRRRRQQHAVGRAPRAVVEHVPAQAATDEAGDRQLARFVGDHVDDGARPRRQPPDEADGQRRGGRRPVPGAPRGPAGCRSRRRRGGVQRSPGGTRPSVDGRAAAPGARRDGRGSTSRAWRSGRPGNRRPAVKRVGPGRPVRVGGPAVGVAARGARAVCGAGGGAGLGAAAQVPPSTLGATQVLREGPGRCQRVFAPTDPVSPARCRPGAGATAAVIRDRADGRALAVTQAILGSGSRNRRSGRETVAGIEPVPRPDHVLRRSAPRCCGARRAATTGHRSPGSPT